MCRKLSIETAHEIAKSHGGECLSNSYINSISKLQWRCNNKHEWNAGLHEIYQGHWCPKCAGNIKYTIRNMQNIARKKKGECLSKVYKNLFIKLKWVCEKGHIWKAKANDIKNGSWCPYCAGLARCTIEQMQELAKEKNGRCISKQYINDYTGLKWKCKEGHEWDAAPSSIKQGTWCPICSEGVSERICRIFFEEIFHEKFHKKRHNWLLSPKNRNLELDGYNDKLKLAFEYQGIQHYNLLGINKSKSRLKYLQKCDQIKRDNCKEKGITLIEVPYTVRYEDMEKFILYKTKSNIPFQNLKYKEWNIYYPIK